MDKEHLIATQISSLVESVQKLDGLCIAVNTDNGNIDMIPKQRATQYFIKKNHAVIVDIPKLDAFKNVATAELAIAVGRRLERFERGAKANAGRTIDSRRKIAQNAIQSRWSAKP